MFQTISNRFEPIKVKKDKTSFTVPDMSYTPREIIAKFSRGERVPLGFMGRYDSEDDKDKLNSYDPNIFVEDPTRDPEFDKFDYVEETRALNKRMKEREEAARSNGEEVESSKRKANDEELSVSDVTKRETTSGDDTTSPQVSKAKSSSNNSV